MQQDTLSEVSRIHEVLSAIGADVYTYFGGINRIGYKSVCEALSKKAADKAILVLATNGGDPNAGYRIARAMLHAYGQSNFSIMVPTSCKSAGTLMCIGAAELVIDDSGELGPLDIQVNKPDEMFQNASGLDILQAVSYIENAALSSFRRALVDINRNSGVSTKTAAGIADGLIASLYQPVVSQIDPVRLGEMQRAINIAQKYGERLDAYHNNLRKDGLQKLIWDYPAHEFVIDRREAKELFWKVRKPTESEKFICDYAVANLGPYWQNQPTVLNFSYVTSAALAKLLAAQSAAQSGYISGEDHGPGASGSHQDVTGAGGEGAEAESVVAGPSGDVGEAGAADR